MRALLLTALLSGCVSVNAAQGRRPPVSAYLVDVALFSAGACVGLDAEFRSHSPAQMAAGYGVAALVWLPAWFVEAP